ncbi:rhomboid family intramembrane serine protease [Candidatus Neptunochlamydia vexilliferae]|uniref:Peptidase S54 rhomboid domain-containing protein n=1 Tax=Candidatus Neptunichlamydia vexilliferae TaxID=1651774 RepID=A0ABS0B1K8_9BACT|nr:rhomboid family intramembrane serine protease [Candidatus Neptunochlamydia vexilliferae]MBF5059737.1 hypothetical protein [Candidatus Neptunochlamydia vexilliferae]
MHRFPIITTLLVVINALVYGLMAFNGAWDPSPDQVINWGGSLADLTLRGEWWRVFTSMFVHIGPIHFLMNMYALIYLGRQLEPFLGRGRFLTGYLSSGVLSALVSLAFHLHSNLVSAGASGAIFGLFGIFIALLTTKLIPDEVRDTILKRILIVVVYNVIYGFSSTGIDNAAHIGGLLFGVMIGYSFYPSIRHHVERKTVSLCTHVVIYGMTAFAALTFFSFYKDSDAIRFGKVQEAVIATYEAIDRLTDEYSKNGSMSEQVAFLNHTVAGHWKKIASLGEQAKTLALHGHKAKLRDYLAEHAHLCSTRFQLVLKAINENTDRYDVEIAALDDDIEFLNKGFNPSE